MRKNSLLKIYRLTLLNVFLTTYSIYGQTEKKIKIIVQLDKPATGIDLKVAPLKYNKKLAYSLTFDDGKDQVYNDAYFLLNGGIRTTDQVNYPGLHYGDGTGNKIPFKAGLAIYTINTNWKNLDLHDNYPGHLTWEQLKILHQNGWDILNHSYTHAANKIGIDYNHEINANTQIIEEKTGFKPTHFVIPAGDQKYFEPAFNNGMVAVYNQNWQLPGFYLGLNVETLTDLKNFKLYREVIDNKTESVLTAQFNKVVQQTASGNPFWYNEFTHGLSFNVFKNYMEYIEKTYGAKGSDILWMAPLQEVFEYQSTRRNAIINTVKNGNQLEITLDVSAIPASQKNNALSFQLKGEGNIVSIDAPNVKITHLKNTTDGVINLEWDPKNLTTASLKVTPLNFIEGEIPYKASWGYHKDRSNQNIAGFFNGLLNESVSMGWEEILPESEIVLNFPDAMHVELSGINFFDGMGQLDESKKVQTIFIERGTGREIIGPDFTGNKYKTWIEHVLPTPIQISSIIIKKKKGGVLPDEIKLFGKYVNYTAPSYTKPTFPLKRMLGINTYPYDNQDNDPLRLAKKTEIIKGYHLIRDYLDWDIMEYTQGQYTFSPAHKGGWKLDEIYARHKANGHEVVVCLKNVPKWIKETYPLGYQDEENAPMEYNSSYTTVNGTSINYFNDAYNAAKKNPESYIKIAKMAFQFAARYGSNTNVNRDLVNVYTKIRWTSDPANEVKIGLDLIKKIEANNEPDRHWKGRQGNQTSDEYAAYLSAFYDGHMGKLGPGVGVKNADPNMIVVCGGIASTHTAFYQGLVDWCKKNRGYLPNGKVNLCFDEINYHAYNNNVGGDQYASGTRVGVAPELSLSPKKIEDFHQFNVESIGNQPIIITETGYDWNSSSQGTKVIGNKTVFDVQADWILRSSLEYAMAGLSGLYFYQLYDDPSGSIINKTQYMTSGHADKTLTKRPAADYIHQVGKQFGDFKPVKRLSTDPRIDIYQNEKGEEMYVCWIPDETGRTLNYQLDLPASDSVKVYMPKAGNDTLSLEKFKIVNGKASLNITETPIFVVPQGYSKVNSFTTSSEIKVQKHNETQLNVYPNPFHQEASVEVYIEESGEAVLSVYDLQGREVKHLYTGDVKVGETKKTSFIASDLPNGMYFIRLILNNKVLTKKVIVI